MTLAINGGTPLRGNPFPKRSPYGPDDIREVTEALNSQDLFSTSNHKIAAFEREFAAKYGVKHTLACSSGTAAVHMAVAAINADPGSEMITAPVTDFGTVAGMVFQGIVPVFADWKPDTFTMDPADIERRITPRTRAIIAVHLFGNPCDMDAILAIAKKHKLPVIEDCAQAYCTGYRDKWVGTLADIGTFSMQMSKHLATGEGGCTITNSDDYAMRMALFRDKGWENRGRWGPRSYTFLGLNYRMNELTGAVALAQLRKVESVVNKMHDLGEKLTSLIRDIPGLVVAPVTPGGRHSYWLYPFRVLKHDPRQFIKALAAEGMPVSWGYTVDPIYLCTDALKAKRTFGQSNYPFNFNDSNIEYRPGLCPVAERELRQIGTFRIYESWSEKDIDDAAAIFHKVASEL